MCWDSSLFLPKATAKFTRVCAMNFIGMWCVMCIAKGLCMASYVMTYVATVEDGKSILDFIAQS